MYICENCYTEYSKEVVCCSELVTNLVEVGYDELNFEEANPEAMEWYEEATKVMD